MTNKIIFRIAGSIMLLTHILCLFLPFYKANSMLLSEMGLSQEQIEIEMEPNISGIAEMLQKREGVSQFDLFRFTAQGNLEQAADTISMLGIGNYEEMKLKLTLFILLMFLVPLLVRIAGGITGIVCKSKIPFIILSVISFFAGICVLAVNMIIYAKMHEMLDSVLGEELSMIQSSMAAIGGNSDILSYFAAPGIGFFLILFLNTVTLVLAVLCGISEKKKQKPKKEEMKEGILPMPQATAGWDIPPADNAGGVAVPKPEQPRGIMRGICGMYEGAEIPLQNEKIMIGRDPSRANLIYDENCTKVSRKHCEVSYNPQTKMFVFVDYSSTGTFKNGNPDCLPQNMKVMLEPGSTIDIGDETNRFILE